MPGSIPREPLYISYDLLSRPLFQILMLRIPNGPDILA